MKHGYGTHLAALALLLAVTPLAALAGVQTTTCTTGPQPGEMTYTFFGCTPNVQADELRISLLPVEITQGEAITGCSVPPAMGMSCSFTATVATFTFPAIGSFECVPNTPGDLDKFGITIATADGSTLVDEQWYRNGVQVAGFIAVIACPSISVDEESWTGIKALYR